MPALFARLSRIGIATLAGGGALCLAAAANAQNFTVELDEAKLLPVERPASDIIIGNPSIADVAVQGAQLLVVTGKSFGTTNLIVLDAKGEEIVNRNLRVISPEKQTVRVYKGGTRFSFDCAERCETAIVPGDNPEWSSSIAKSVRDKMGVAQSAITGDGGPSQ